MSATETHWGNDPMGAPTTHKGLKENCSAPECMDETCPHCGKPDKDHCAICSLCLCFCSAELEAGRL